jgi:hypothetical protein
LSRLTGAGHLPDRAGGVFFDAFTEFLKDFNGSLNLGGCGWLHGGIKFGFRVKI